MNTYLSIFQRIITLFIQISIWKALLGNAGHINTNIGRITIKEMIIYTLISTCISIFISNNVILRIDNKIKTGEIAIDLIKPINFKMLLFCELIGKNIYKIIFQLVPLILIIALIGDMPLISWKLSILFIVCCINSLIINFMIYYILGLTGFWYLSVWHLDRFMYDLIRLFSGAFIPLWFFPDFLNQIAKYLPFRLIYFTPISIYMNKVSSYETVNLIFQQTLWILILVIIEKFLWHKGIKKLVLQGG
ncbi:ABC-2 family transporter protein [Vallitalea pronyensis]|uniref:ABC-2 family transporter protein n=1 Tax=Vallitalea pronyensis TaxID=1348613 RepID=A0A8J8MLS1_9FIRM|nr:ABC-2 family transporter protein [Vallitalea pronyensis]QUI23841.1 ABC-2 family transporter protein [Vallitalea pronyensis]